MIFSWLTGLRRAVVARLTIGIGGLLALGLTTGQGLLEAMQPPELPALAAGQPLDAGRWRLVLLEARLGAQSRPDGPPGPAGTQFLTLDLELTNRSSQSDNTFARLLTVDPPIPGLAPNPVWWLLRDKAILAALQPGLSERVRVVWRMPEGTGLPERLRLVVTGETFKPRDNLFAAPGWFSARPVAAAALPILRPEPQP